MTRLNCSNKFLGIKFKIVYFDVLIVLFGYLSVLNNFQYVIGRLLFINTVRYVSFDSRLS